MRRPKDNAQYQAPFMAAFRDAFDARDAKDMPVRVVDGERVIEGRGSRQRRGDEVALKRDLSTDLVSLLNTINFESAVEIDRLGYVRGSIINYGLPDITHLTSEEVGVDAIRDRILRALMDFEPRIISDSIVVEKTLRINEVDQRVQFSVSCEMFCAPVDIAVDFVAELEISSGKVNLTRLPLSA
ncbi:MAG: GPW/gp25 family protein [Rhizobiaceae bacterium]|nr:GPW/gp25 family protein [Rhizobiaceae bacterium]